MLCDDQDIFVSDESLLTLAHYLDCTAMMAQCEAVLMALVEDGRDDTVGLITESL